MVYHGAGALLRLKAKPEFKSKNVKVEAYRIDGKGDAGLLIAAMDESKGTGKGFDTLYVDCNRNFDLTDDSPISLTARREREADGEWITVNARQCSPCGGETGNPIEVQLRLCNHRTWSHIVPSWTGGWKGRIETNKGTVDCAVVDVNGDGIFGGTGTGSNVDSLFVDANGLGSLSISDDSRHRIRLSRVPFVGWAFYQVSVADAGRTLRVDRYAGPMGTLVVKATDVNGASGAASQMSLAGSQGVWSLEGLSGEKPAQIPVGDATLTHCTVALANGTKPPTVVSCELKRPVKILDGSEQAVEIRGKVSAEISPSVKTLRWKQGSSESFDWVVKIGSDVTVTSLGRGSLAPKLEFTDKRGKVVATKTSSYG